MRTLLPEIMCAAGAFGLAGPDDCLRYWRLGRAPLVVHAAAFMHSDAEASWP
jgi:hypothetical protein